MDKIFVRNLVVPCRIGQSVEERQRKQNVVIELEISHHLRAAGATDDIRRTINYSEIIEDVVHFVSSGEFRLLERLAEGIASLLLKKGAWRVKVTATKQKYSRKPIMGVEITRERPHA